MLYNNFIALCSLKGFLIKLLSRENGNCDWLTKMETITQRRVTSLVHVHAYKQGHVNFTIWTRGLSG